jgi:hypothetical protein
MRLLIELEFDLFELRSVLELSRIDDYRLRANLETRRN